MPYNSMLSPPMTRFLLIILGWFSCFLLFANEQTAAAYFEKIKHQPQARYDFLKAMPKGGELHYHFSGGVYPEVMLDLAQKQHYCLDKHTFTLKPYVKTCDGVPSSFLRKNTLWYKKTLQAWSLANFNAPQQSAHDHFFATFVKFHKIFTDNRPAVLAAILQRAAAQHERYMEIMFLPKNTPAYAELPHTFDEKHLNLYHQQLLSNPVFQQSLDKSMHEIQRIKKDAHTLLHCDSVPNQPACKIEVTFQSHALREQNLDKIFIQLLFGFILAQRSPHVVGVNLVQAEDGVISRRDYQRQMHLLDFLHKLYPKVHIALHAGELSAQTASLEDRQSHIHDAMIIGHAERIGHGVDIATEKGYSALLGKMAASPVAVEVNLTSNRYILQVSGRQHPLPNYLQHHVPVVLSTDDEGVLRTSLTREYELAVMQYQLNYLTLKQISRNALSYSFLPGKSLWLDAQKATPIKACKQLESESCLSWIRHSQKAKLQWSLEQDFKLFEAGLVKRIA